MVLWCYGGGAVEELWRSSGGTGAWVRGTVVMDGFGTGVDYTDYMEAEWRPGSGP